MLNSIMVEKKDHTHEKFDMDKVIKAVNKSARRSILRKFNAEETAEISRRVSDAVIALDKQVISYEDMHAIIETTLNDINDKVCIAYKDYRNWREHHLAWDELYQKSQSIRYRGDKDNSNSDSSLVSTKCSLIYHQYNKELYQRYFLTAEELEDCKIGYYYIHDMSSRLDTINCCLFDIQSVLKDGFEMGNIGYSEPKTLDVVFDVIGDIVLCAASQQYGGFTLPEIDSVLAPYAQKSFDMYYNDEIEFAKSALRKALPIMYRVGSEAKYQETLQAIGEDVKKLCKERAEAKVRRDFEQGFQGWENKFNTVASSRGDYPFITITTGHDTTHFGLMSSEILLDVRKNGQGKPGFKHVVPFPKIVFLYDEELHGEGAPYEWLFDKSIACSQKAMYPDYLSLTGDGYVPSMYKKYGKIISPMGKNDTTAHVKPSEPLYRGCQYNTIKVAS